MRLRIVFNEQSECYRVEAHGLFGWNFVTDDETGGYLSFEDEAAARAWVKKRSGPLDDDPHRRWKVISVCD